MSTSIAQHAHVVRDAGVSPDRDAAPRTRKRRTGLCTCPLAALLAGLLLFSACDSNDGSSPTMGASSRPSADQSLRDNGDGTISDLTTGLMWEKKCRDCSGLHDANSSFYWSGDGRSETIWDWLDDVNTEAGHGLGGHDDWRIPNVKELMTIVDYEYSDPAAAPAFVGDACDDGCEDATRRNCSCTTAAEHWTSTTFADFPAHALTIDFEDGMVGDELKTLAFPVRAVRGGN